MIWGVINFTILWWQNKVNHRYYHDLRNKLRNSLEGDPCRQSGHCTGKTCAFCVWRSGGRHCSNGGSRLKVRGRNDIPLILPPTMKILLHVTISGCIRDIIIQDKITDLSLFWCELSSLEEGRSKGSLGFPSRHWGRFHPVSWARLVRAHRSTLCWKINELCKNIRYNPIIRK